MMHPSIAVFDIDGTLTNSVRPHQIAFEAALRSFNFPALRTQWDTYKDHSDSAIFREAWEEAGLSSELALEALEARYLAEYNAAVLTHSVTEIPGASAFLRRLEQSPDWRVVFATGSLREGAKRKLEVVGVDPSAAVVITASEFQTREDIVSTAVRAAKLRFSVPHPARVVSVGDGIWDLKTAQNLGYEFIGIALGAKAEALGTNGSLVVGNFLDPRVLSAFNLAP